MILNEPLVFTDAGYFFGIHAPGKRGFPNFFPAAHHAAICQAEGARIIKSLFPQSKVGTTFSYSHIDRVSDKERDLMAAKKVDTLLNRFFLEPLLGRPYPIYDLSLLGCIEKYMKQGDDQLLAFDMNFIGLQNYTREIVKYSPFNLFLQAKIVNVEKRNGFHTAMNWEVHPPSIYKALHRLSEYKEIKEIIVTENGAAFEDVVINDAVDDFHRKNYLQKYIEQVLRAKLEGVNVTGYFVWTLLDNFEWAKSLHPRFGLVHDDFISQKRIIKSSGLWYGEFLKNKKSFFE